ncbi:MAG: isomerase [endosymbiont of Galathealinum brachiosum]|uniref:Isomerase n=1 Tax=endosymbiont of Galathealinum brachiosum TaxID=2200906 RepID=A0A370DCW6_9GAMM|nr:MAG: isomerase [endosymbiont of Galathealinum brachiosum]
MTKYLIHGLVVVFSLLIVSCGSDKESITKQQSDIEYDILLKGGEKNISFINQARPVLEKRCIVCHGCYDAPCQLKLTSIEGIKRGANPEKVYNSERIIAAQPTRLFIDAKSEEEWREKGFNSVLNEQENNEINNLRHSVLYKMLRLKQLNPQPRVGMIDEKIDLGLNREQTCPVNEEFNDYAEEFPFQGMPFATPNLSDDEYHILVKWISQGMPDDSQITFTESTQNQIKTWEDFLNKKGLKYQLISRYLYEHLFMAHLNFKGESSREFFRIVRSSTPAGQTINEIATIRPYDYPGPDSFYYRLRYEESSIVDKSHVVYQLSDKKLERFKELFINPDYKVDKLPSYEAAVASNPIRTFADIPVESRYRFLLDDAKFFIDGFIKGPVCRGQVALNVIEDNFWVFFSDPKKLRVNHNTEYLKEIAGDFNLPAEQGNTYNPFSIWTNYWELQRDNMLKRQEEYIKLPKMNLDKALEFIWDGSDSLNKNNNALTVFRHFDSATVKQGLLGDYPETAWVIDYPIFERIHYLLVAGYDVSGNVGHQFNTRIYMDFLRMEAENTFLAFLPVKHRREIRASWYKGIREGLQPYFKEPDDWLNVQIVNGFKTNDPQMEFYRKIEQRLSASDKNIDLINRCKGVKCNVKNKLSEMERHIQRIAKIKGERLSIFPDTAFLKVISEKETQVYTIINNKGYKNISSLLSDTENRDKHSDTLTIYKGLLGSYPNFFFVVNENKLSDFANEIIAISSRDDYERFVGRYGVRRTSSDFWKEADWFNEQFAKQDPVDYGIFDLYRYNNR